MLGNEKKKILGRKRKIFERIHISNLWGKTKMMGRRQKILGRDKKYYGEMKKFQGEERKYWRKIKKTKILGKIFGRMLGEKTKMLGRK